ncbi:DUF4199 domain-containing protein [Dyadobacter chenwenxiniae]|uniref:DUF4199 domain-containing protein n=1 Tax=Dyadobacter chenwenxiniae TaxID=2906456 RepID=A0A9X1TFY3_9BACT|nr:DUF4199 domain-containing protein [Dyadobacter chenwenxiniae]MCF0063159.1 DUF4199 domain-containing protein [Dyadobacter chenwenxiniae]UON84673.1 DUF4199 domain-containing protein [Dyadobacter chenwenxiniae]
MKKIIVVCGLISGIIVSTFMVSSVAVCYSTSDFEGNMLLGYAAMLLSFSLIFVGIKNFRDKFNGGFVTFGKALQIGLLITLIASTVYVIVWLIDYYLFVPEFMERYTTHVMRELQREGATAQELQEKSVEMDGYREMYKSPLMVILFTYAEILPIGLIVSLLSALILKKKPSQSLPII